MNQSNKDYRTEIPNIIDDLGLDPHERALYVHYKRACGGNDCEWVESVRITAQRTKMSVGRASQARKSLVERGLIRLISKGNDGTAIRVVDIWDLNKTFYSQDYKPDIDGWTVEQLKEWCSGVHNMNTLEEQKASNSEHQEPGVQDVNASVHNMKAGVHNMNNKKEPIRKNLLEESPIGDSGKPPPVESQSDSKKPKTLIREKFLELTNLPPPKPKSKEDGFWWGKFGEILGICKDTAKAVNVVSQVVNYMQAEGLTISGPQSIINLCRSVMAGQTLNGAYHGRKPNTASKQSKNISRETGRELDPRNDDDWREMLRQV